MTMVRVFSSSRLAQLLDAEGAVVPPDDTEEQRAPFDASSVGEFSWHVGSGAHLRFRPFERIAKPLNARPSSSGATVKALAGARITSPREARLRTR